MIQIEAGRKGEVSSRGRRMNSFPHMKTLADMQGAGRREVPSGPDVVFPNRLRSLPVLRLGLQMDHKIPWCKQAAVTRRRNMAGVSVSSCYSAGTGQTDTFRLRGRFTRIELLWNSSSLILIAADMELDVNMLCRTALAALAAEISWKQS